MQSVAFRQTLHATQHAALTEVHVEKHVNQGPPVKRWSISRQEKNNVLSLLPIMRAPCSLALPSARSMEHRWPLRAVSSTTVHFSFCHRRSKISVDDVPHLRSFFSAPILARLVPFPAPLVLCVQRERSRHLSSYRAQKPLSFRHPLTMQEASIVPPLLLFPKGFRRRCLVDASREHPSRRRQLSRASRQNCTFRFCSLIFSRRFYQQRLGISRCRKAYPNILISDHDLA